MSDGIREVLDSLGNGDGQGRYYNLDLGQSWAAGDKNAQKEVARALSAAGLAIDEVTAKTLDCKLDSFERLDRMLASAEARRNNALREIDRHRRALGAAVRSSMDEPEDVEFQDVETGQTGGGAQPRILGTETKLRGSGQGAPTPLRPFCGRLSRALSHER